MALGPNRNLDCEQPGQDPTGHFETAPLQVRKLCGAPVYFAARFVCLLFCAPFIYIYAEIFCTYIYHGWGVWPVSDYVHCYFFFTAERRGHFVPSQKAPQRQLHDHAYIAGHFNFRSVFVFVCHLLYTPPIAGASGVGGGLILPGCENMSMKDLLALMDGSST